VSTPGVDLLSHETELLAAYETQLAQWLATGLLQRSIVEKDTGEDVDLPTPWVAVSLGYAHGLSFGIALGVLTASESEELDLDGMDHLNAAEWENYEFLTEPAALKKLAVELNAIARSSDVAVTVRVARQIHVRVATGLRAVLVDAGKLDATGLVYATDFEQSEMLENIEASNPKKAIEARASWLG
jgi:hypothetical protein